MACSSEIMHVCHFWQSSEAFMCMEFWGFFCVISDVTVYKKIAKHNSAALGIKSRNIKPPFFNSKAVQIFLLFLCIYWLLSTGNKYLSIITIFPDRTKHISITYLLDSGLATSTDSTQTPEIRPLRSPQYISLLHHFLCY